MAKPKLLLVGYGRAGKDEGLAYLSALTGLRNGGCTSIYLLPYVAAELGASWTETYEARHRNREEWFRIGNKLREKDPGILLRQALAQGDLTGGVRDIEEIIAARTMRLVDLIVWIENERVPIDNTVKFDSSHCDLIIQNNGTLEEYHEKLNRLATFVGLV